MTTETQLSYTQLWDRYKAQEKRIAELEQELERVNRILEMHDNATHYDENKRLRRWLTCPYSHTEVYICPKCGWDDEALEGTDND